jgi:LacI family transcriptional regulator
MGVQKIRLKDVAERAGVAANTASTILNRRPNSWASKETEERVFQAAAELGYKPNRAAQSLRFGRFETLALLVADWNDPFNAAFADAMERAAEARGYELLIETSRNDPARTQRILSELVHHNVDGLVWLMTPANQATGELPVVAVGALGAVLPAIDSVLADFGPGLRGAVASLAEQGHRRFALLCSSEAEHIEVGLRHVLAENGMGACEVIRCNVGGEGDALNEILRRSDGTRPTALFAQSDLQAIAAMRNALAVGFHVPRKLSIVSMEGTPLAARLPIALSVIAQPITEMAEWAVEMLVSRVEERSVQRHAEQTVFATEYIVRESCGPVTAP